MNTGIVSFKEQQLDCLLLAIEGRSSAEIGELLGLTTDAAEHQLSEAIRRLAIAREASRSHEQSPT